MMISETGFPFRIGFGYDVHRLVSGRKLILGGVEIPFSLGLDGHSDADVLLHAICDAVLGSLALRDIGYHFPNTDSGWKDIASTFLLRTCVSKVAALNYVIGNIDATIIAEEPKINPFITDMQQVIADCCGLQPGQVSIKATTQERLGFEGRKEGICAHAVALVYKIR